MKRETPGRQGTSTDDESRDRRCCHRPSTTGHMDHQAARSLCLIHGRRSWDDAALQTWPSLRRTNRAGHFHRRLHHRHHRGGGRQGPHNTRNRKVGRQVNAFTNSTSKGRGQGSHRTGRRRPAHRGGNQPRRRRRGRAPRHPTVPRHVPLLQASVAPRRVPAQGRHMILLEAIEAPTRHHLRQVAPNHKRRQHRAQAVPVPRRLLPRPLPASLLLR